MTAKTSYQRVLLKLSGEAFLNKQESSGINPDSLSSIAQELKQAHSTGVELAVVLGAGNLFRGRSLIKTFQMRQTKADEIGMVATVLNGLALKQALLAHNCPSRVFSSIEVGGFVEVYQEDRVLQALENKEIVIFVGGTSHPFFTTDTAASLRACEIQADALLKATKVDGVYSSDPKTDPQAKKYDELSYNEVLQKDLKVMDATAVSLCREQKLPICVFNMHEKENLVKVINKTNCGTLIN